MGAYSEAAEFYDVLYGAKDYAAEANLLTKLIQEHRPGATALLDVGCGTGANSRCLIDGGQLTDGWIFTVAGDDDDVTVCRLSRTLIDGDVSRLEFEYLFGDRNRLEAVLHGGQELGLAVR